LLASSLVVTLVFSVAKVEVAFFTSVVSKSAAVDAFLAYSVIAVSATVTAYAAAVDAAF
jgi:hypothetical protein